MNKVLKIVTTILMGVVIIIGIAATALAVPTFTNAQWSLTAVQTSSMSPEIFAGSLVVTSPLAIDSLKAGDTVVVGVRTEAPKLGKIIDYGENLNGYSIRAYGSLDNPADIFSYSTTANVDRVLFAIPFAGTLFALLTSPMGAAIFAGIVALIGGIYLKVFFTKKPVIEEPEEDTDSIMVMQEIFRSAPPKPTRQERKIIIQNMKKEKANV